MISSRLKDISKPRQDLLATGLIASVSGLITYWLTHQIPANLYNFFDVWFQADLPLQLQRAAYQLAHEHHRYADLQSLETHARHCVHNIGFGAGALCA